MTEIALVVGFLAAITLLIALGVPVAFAMGALSIVGIVVFLSPDQLPQIARVVFTSGTSDALVIIPFFLLMAELMSAADFPKRMFNAVQAWFSRVPGSIAVSSVLACAGFAAVSGSSAATCATIGVATGPEMLERGYSKRLAAGVLTTSGTLGMMIPPSLSFVIYGIITETSIVKLFIAGILPGILLTVLLIGAVVAIVSVYPHLAPRRAVPIDRRERLGLVFAVFPVLALSAFILLGIYLGWVTPTEASAVGAMAALLLALASGRLTRQGFVDAIVRTAITSCVIMFLVFGGLAFAFMIASIGLPDVISTTIAELQLNRWLIMIAIIVFLLILGCFMDPLGMQVITLPSLFPIATKLGFDPVWFGVIVTLNIELAMITPPVGLNMFVLNGAVPQFEMRDILVGSLPFAGVLVLGMAILMLWPEIALVLVPAGI